MGVTERYLYGLFGGSVRRNDLPMLKAPFERHELRGGYSIDKQSFAGHERHVLRERSGSYVAVAALDRLVTLSHYLGATIEDIKTSFQAPDGKPLTGPREVVHGERESFIGEYSWQRSGLGVGSPAMSVAGGGCSRVDRAR